MLSEVGRLTSVLVKHPRDAFVSTEIVAASGDRSASAPVLAAAVDEFDAFLERFVRPEPTSIFFRGRPTRLDSIYARDASIVSARGMILCRMGKTLRAGEPAAQKAFTGSAFRSRATSSSPALSRGRRGLA